MKLAARVAGTAVCLAVLYAGASMPAAGEETSAEPSAAGDEPVRIAAADRTDELEERLARLERLVEMLQEQLQSLRAGAGADGTVVELRRQIDLLTKEIETLRLGRAAAPTASESVFGLGPAASKVYAVDRGVSIGGYGEAIFEGFEGERDDGERSGKTDRADFLRAVTYIGYKFTDKVVFNSEIEYEHASTGESGEVSVEFAAIDFLHDDAFNVRAGMLLVPVGFVNELHEPPVFLGARRPDVERSIIPATWREIGAGVFGDAGPVSYRAYVMTNLDAGEFGASGIRGGRQKGSKATAEDLAGVVRVDVEATPWLTVGGALVSGNTGQGIKDSGLAEIDAGLTMYEVHADLRYRGIQARALYVESELDDVSRLNEALGFTGADSIGERQTGWYGEVGYDVLTRAPASDKQSLVVFVRREEFDTQSDVPGGFLRDLSNDVSSWTAGLSWKPILNVVVKADAQNFENRAGTGVDQVNLALGFMF